VRDEITGGTIGGCRHPLHLGKLPPALGVNDIAKQVGISLRMLERRFALMRPRSIAQELSMARAF